MDNQSKNVNKSTLKTINKMYEKITMLEYTRHELHETNYDQTDEVSSIQPLGIHIRNLSSDLDEPGTPDNKERPSVTTPPPAPKKNILNEILGYSSDDDNTDNDDNTDDDDDNTDNTENMDISSESSGSTSESSDEDDDDDEEYIDVSAMGNITDDSYGTDGSDEEDFSDDDDDSREALLQEEIVGLVDLWSPDIKYDHNKCHSRLWDLGFPKQCPRRKLEDSSLCNMCTKNGSFGGLITGPIAMHTPSGCQIPWSNLNISRPSNNNEEMSENGSDSSGEEYDVVMTDVDDTTDSSYGALSIDSDEDEDEDEYHDSLCSRCSAEI
jgi:hypothetical protein